MCDPNDQLPPLEIGNILNDKYKIIADQSANQEGYPVYPFIQHTYIAQNTYAKPSVCVSLRVLGSSSSTSTYVSCESDLRTEIGTDAAMHQYVLSPSDTFWYQGKQDKKGKAKKHLCLVYEELFGPDLWYMGEVTGPENDLYPAPMIWKMASQALESLKYLHSKGVCHGDLSTDSLVLTYPNLDRTRPEKILDFYSQPNEFGGIQSLNETSTGKEGKPFDLSIFRLRIQGLGKAFMKPEYHADHSLVDDDEITTFAPEVILENTFTSATDIWNLALILTDLASGQPSYATLIGSPSNNPRSRLLESRTLLGELPQRFLSLLSSNDNESIPRLNGFASDSLFAAVKKSPSPRSGVRRFSEQELRLLVDLLQKMLAYEPEARISAGEALQHDFFERVRGGS